MGERAKEIDYKKIRGTEALTRIKSVYTRVDITPVTGSMLAEMNDDVPEVFETGRFIIVDTKTSGRIGMINPKDTGISVEYIDLFTGIKEKITIGDIVGKIQFQQCMNVLNGRGDTREILSDIAKKAGKGAITFVKGPGRKIAGKAWEGTKGVFGKVRELSDWVIIDENRKNNGR